MISDLPKIHMDEVSRPFWEAARASVLTVQQCGSCGRYRMPPTPWCPKCQSAEVCWPKLSGNGQVFSFTVRRPRTADATPVVLALVELPDAPGARLFCRLEDVLPEDVRIGMDLELKWSPASAMPITSSVPVGMEEQANDALADTGWAYPVFTRRVNS
jgi:uncharacterized protein